ncbi:Antibiotic biosynthesis monooxygenase [Desulfovibrio sp. DV]|uniref:putative quinol monooxygenase n=1 Tax=Desulfovibrio sp. DV TaxID=1844708 RepID=UPI00094BA16F|nr:putative quinol monooxygenase [Desulfovibrio sp. DV]OLN27833.1 Antibiotic biosynthesis monooxygenase [Desulfovibrio sp. DV]
MAADTVHVVAKFVAKPGQEAALKTAITGLIAPTQKDPGYIAYDLYESTQRPGEFVLIEAWETKELLAAHLDTPHLNGFKAAAPGLLTTPMSVTLFNEIPGF